MNLEDLARRVNEKDVPSVPGSIPQISGNMTGRVFTKHSVPLEILNLIDSV
jgi:hypothetical protein